MIVYKIAQYVLISFFIYDRSVRHFRRVFYFDFLEEEIQLYQSINQSPFLQCNIRPAFLHSRRSSLYSTRGEFQNCFLSFLCPQQFPVDGIIICVKNFE